MTKIDKTGQILRGQLSIEQHNAIDLLILGKKDREVAEVCGVTRQTVNTWKHEPEFLAELNLRRAGLWDEDIDKLRSLVGEAIAVLENDLRGDDKIARRVAALHILRAVGIFGNDWQPKGPTSVSRITLSQFLEEG